MFVVWGLGIAIVAMVILLVVGVMLGWNKKGAPAQADPTGQAAAVPSNGPAVLEIDTAPDSRLYTLAGDGSRVALHIAAPTGDEIVVIDTVKNRVISRIKLKPGGAAP